jgi:hypothetical protein
LDQRYDAGDVPVSQNTARHVRDRPAITKVFTPTTLGSTDTPKESHMRRTAAALLAISLAGVLLASCGGGSSLPSSLAGKTGAQLLAKEESSFRAEGTVVGVDKTKIGSVRETTTTHVGVNEGYRIYQGASANGTLVYDQGTVYLKGDLNFLEDNLGTSVNLAAWTDKWISLTATNANYQHLVSGLTMASALQSSMPIGPFTINGTGLFDGRDTLKVTGHPNTSNSVLKSVKSSLYIALTKPYLPVGLTLQGTVTKTKIDATLTFSHWGATLTLPTVTDPTSIQQTSIS